MKYLWLAAASPVHSLALSYLSNIELSVVTSANEAYRRNYTFLNAFPFQFLPSEIPIVYDNWKDTCTILLQ